MSLAIVSSNSWYSGYWNTRPTRKRVSRLHLPFSFQMDWPSSSTSPSSGLSSPFEVLDQGGLARAGVADHAEDLAFLYLQVNMVERLALKRGACAIHMGQAPRFKDG